MNSKYSTFHLMLMRAAVVACASITMFVIQATGQEKKQAAPPPATQAKAPDVDSGKTGKPPMVMLDVPEIAQRVNPVVVNIRSTSQMGESLGSGFIIDQKGLIVTNLHLITAQDQRPNQPPGGDQPDKSIKLGDRIWVTMADGRQFQASVKGYDEATDLAVLQIVPAGAPLPVAELGNSDALRVGEWVIAIGNPLGLDHTVTLGILSAKGRGEFGGQFDDFLQTDAAINPGNSGGPLVNTQGKIIGINALVLERSQGLSFAIPINTLMSILPQLIERGRVTRGYLGVELRDLNPDIRGVMNLTSDVNGVVVIRAERGTAGALAGLRQNDLITSVNNQPITSRIQFNRLIAAKRPGEKVEIEIMRDGKKYSVTAGIGEK